MKILRVLSIAVFSLMLCACACTKSSKGTGAPGSGEGEGIPAAEGEGPLKDVHFAFDSSELSPSEKNVLRDNAKWLMDNPSATVEVEGHCDERGTNEYNMGLGERRAKSTATYTKSLGVPASRMSTISYGEEMPLAPGHDEGAWAKNRRAHFRIKSGK